MDGLRSLQPSASRITAPLLLLLLALLPATGWSQAPGVWSRFQIPAGGPPGLTPRSGHSAVYDPVRRRMLVYGGTMGTRAAILALDLVGTGAWTTIPVVGGATLSATGMSVVHDSRRDRLIVFGGTDAGGYTNDQVVTLALTGTPSWTGPELVERPSPRLAHAAVYDSVGDRMLVFGGYAPSTGFLNDVWQLTLSGTPAWTRLAPGGVAPSPRSGSGAVYDGVGRRMLVFGGNVSGVPDDGVWALSLEGEPVWSRVIPAAPGPPGRFFHGAAWDPLSSSILVVGGYNGQTLMDVWRLSLTGAPEWIPVNPVGATPTARHWFGAVFDPVGRKLVVCGGRNEETNAHLGDTDVLNLDAVPPRWEIGNSLGPGPRYGATAIYDSTFDRVLLYGGQLSAMGEYPPAGSYWQLRFGVLPSWTFHDFTGSRPGYKVGHVAFRDRERSRMLVTAGGGMDVWALSLNARPSWTFVSLPGQSHPVSRTYPAAAYDETRNRIIVFGGAATNSSILDDLWTANLNTAAWTLVPGGDPRPSGRYGATGLYDRAADRFVMLGGIPSGTNTPAVDDGWTLEFGAGFQWRLFGSFVLDQRRYLHSTVFDSRRNRAVVFGGQSFPMLNADTWVLPFSSPLTASPLVPNGPEMPVARFAHAAAYDSRRDRMLVFGGVGVGGAILGDAWSLTWADVPTSIQASVQSWDVSGDRVRITWSLSEPVAGLLGIQRRTAESHWELRGQAAVDGVGRLVFEDSVEPGGRYFYAIQDERGEPVGQVEIAAPRKPRASLEGLSPNPSRDTPAVRFSLSDFTPATLALFDLQGREVWKGDVGPLGPGEHLLHIGTDVSLKPGIYLVRLRHADGEFSRRCVVLR